MTKNKILYSHKFSVFHTKVDVIKSIHRKPLIFVQCFVLLRPSTNITSKTKMHRLKCGKNHYYVIQRRPKMSCNNCTIVIVNYRVNIFNQNVNNDLHITKKQTRSLYIFIVLLVALFNNQNNDIIFMFIVIQYNIPIDPFDSF